MITLSGHNREGNISLLRRWGSGWDLRCISWDLAVDHALSLSTSIRMMIQEGDWMRLCFGGAQLRDQERAQLGEGFLGFTANLLVKMNSFPAGVYGDCSD
jgi:FAD synthase